MSLTNSAGSMPCATAVPLNTGASRPNSITANVQVLRVLSFMVTTLRSCLTLVRARLAAREWQLKPRANFPFADLGFLSTASSPFRHQINSKRANLGISASGPTLPTWGLQQVGSYLGYSGRAANIIARAALDPELPSDRTVFLLCSRAGQLP